MASRPNRACSSTPPAATTIRARTTMRCGPRCAAIVDRGYTVVKMKIGGASIDEDRQRIEAVLAEIGRTAHSSRSTPTAASICETAIAYAKMLRDYPLFWYEEAGRSARLQLQAALARVLSGPDGDRRESLQPPGCAQPAPLRRHAARSRLAAVRLRALVRAVRVPAHARVLNDARLVAAPLHSAWRSPDVAQHRRRARTRRQRELSRSVPAIRRLSRRRARRRAAIVTMPELPGIGFEGKADLYAEMRQLAQ